MAPVALTVQLAAAGRLLMTAGVLAPLVTVMAKGNVPSVPQFSEKLNTPLICDVASAGPVNSWLRSKLPVWRCKVLVTLTATGVDARVAVGLGLITGAPTHT